MSIDLTTLATWTYSDFTLIHVASGQSVTLDIAANLPLHQILSDQHWYLPPEFKHDYNLAAESDWVERDIKWNRASEDPPVVRVEQTIGAGDHVDYTVIELEDDAEYGPIIQTMTDLYNDGATNGFTKAHIRKIEKERLRLWQLSGVI